MVYSDTASAPAASAAEHIASALFVGDHLSRHACRPLYPGMIRWNSCRSSRRRRWRHPRTTGAKSRLEHAGSSGWLWRSDLSPRAPRCIMIGRSVRLSKTKLR